MTTSRILKFSLLLLAVEAAYALWVLLSIPGDPHNALAFGLSSARLVMAAMLALAALGALAAFLWALLSEQRSQRIADGISTFFAHKWNFAALLAIFSLSLLFILNQHFAPPVFKARLLRLYPIVLFTLLLSTHGLAWLLIGEQERWQRRALLLTLSILLASFYLSGALNFSTVNSIMDTSDQRIQVEFARLVRQTGFRFTGGRNFMPGFAYLQALFLDPNASSEALFILGKQVNILFSLAFLAGSYFLFKRYLRPLSAYLLTLLIAFSLYIYKAAYYQPELLFYSLFFLVFLFMARQIINPNWKEAFLLGVLLGLAHLTKAAVLPAVLLFIVASLLRAALASREGRPQKTATRPRTQIANLAIVLALFLVTVGPYILESKQRYGQFFYNVNTTFYVWYDSWRDAKEGTRAHGDNEGWPDMPEELVPSASKYFRSHSLSEILDRLERGIQSQTTNLLQPFSRFSYPLIYLTFALIAAWLVRAQLGTLMRRYWLLVVFAVTFFGGYLLLYAFYSPIADHADYRFTYSLYAPFLFSAFVVVEKVLDPEKVYKLASIEVSGNKWRKAMHGLVAILLSYEIVFDLPNKLTIFDWYGK